MILSTAFVLNYDELFRAKKTFQEAGCINEVCYGPRCQTPYVQSRYGFNTFLIEQLFNRYDDGFEHTVHFRA